MAKSWLVKFPRGNSEDDRTVLRNEANYLEVARALEFTVGEALYYEENALFIPRFDRETTADGLQRWGVESLYAMAGVAEYGKAEPHELYCHALAAYITDPETAITEYVLRDALNVAMGNKDNDGRNTAVIKRPGEGIGLSPIFDFAPMWLDPEGVARVTRWEDSATENAAQPIWGKVAESLSRWLPAKQLRPAMVSFGEHFEGLPELMDKQGIETALIDPLMKTIDGVVRNLKDAEVKTPSSKKSSKKRGPG